MSHELMIAELRRRAPDFAIDVTHFDLVTDSHRVSARFTLNELAIEVARVVSPRESVTEWKDRILRQCLSDLTASRAHSRIALLPRSAEDHAPAI